MKEELGSAETKTLAREYKIGLLRNDVTSDESLAYEAYLSYLAGELGFTVTFSESTEGNATNEVNQIQTWAAAGYDAVISMSSGSVYDQATTCQDNDLMFVVFAAHPEEDDLVDLRTLDNYLGAVGPAKYNEAKSAIAWPSITSSRATPTSPFSAAPSCSVPRPTLTVLAV